MNKHKCNDCISELPVHLEAHLLLMLRSTELNTFGMINTVYRDLLCLAMGVNLSFEQKNMFWVYAVCLNNVILVNYPLRTTND